MRVLFVSDTHLGLDQPARPRVERRRRGDDFLACFERALEPALAGEVDVLVHGGDLHYRSRIPAHLAEAALAPLRRVADAGVPVILVPGNHERSRLPYPLLALHERLHVLDRPRTVVLEARGLRVAFGGFPHAGAVRARFGDLLAATGLREATADVRLLCLHQCVEGATCGPGDFTFRHGDDVIRRADLPREVAAVLCGHVHRHQILSGRPPVVYAGSVERTSFAEAGEPKGYVVLEVGAEGLRGLAFRALPARPMVVRRVALEGLDAAGVLAAVAAAVLGTPPDAVVQLRVQGDAPGAAGALTAPALRAIAGGRSVSVVAPWTRPAGSDLDRGARPLY